MKQEVEQLNQLTRYLACLAEDSMASAAHSLPRRNRNCCTCRWPATGCSHSEQVRSRPDPGIADRSFCGYR